MEKEQVVVMQIICGLKSKKSDPSIVAPQGDQGRSGSFRDWDSVNLSPFPRVRTGGRPMGVLLLVSGEGSSLPGNKPPLKLLSFVPPQTLPFTTTSVFKLAG